MDILNKDIFRVAAVVERCTGINAEKLVQHRDEPLTGKLFNIGAVDLVYIFLEVEREFKTKIQAEALRDYRFCSIEGICTAIHLHPVMETVP